MKNTNLRRSIFAVVLPLGLLFFLSLILPRNADVVSDDLTPPSTEVLGERQKGAHVFGIVDSTDFESFHQNNLEWITMVSWGFQDDFDSPVVTHHNGDSVAMMRHDSGWIRRIESVRAAGFKVFFKPHLWVLEPSDGKWRSDIFPTSEENWELWQESYRNFIIRYARVAEEANADMFCIGAEFSRLAIEKPEFWVHLIQEIRRFYSGKLTYAANWYEEFEAITFWGQLDYIGIQAYFPLVNHINPSVKQISRGWKRYLPVMEAVHEKFDRKILFTEMGYKSTTDSAMEPWRWVEDPSYSNVSVSNETQANCYEAFFNTVWEEEWFAGVHIWQLRTDHVNGRGHSEVDFTPQGKPAEGVIARGFH
jgi:hypothetical protein